MRLWRDKFSLAQQSTGMYTGRMIRWGQETQPLHAHQTSTAAGAAQHQESGRSEQIQGGGQKNTANSTH